MCAAGARDEARLGRLGSCHNVFREEVSVYARATIVDQADPEQITRALREQVLTQARELEGFRGLIGLVDRSSGKAVGYTLWESADAMRASEEAANRVRSEAMDAAGAPPSPTVERYEVIVWEV